MQACRLNALPKNAVEIAIYCLERPAFSVLALDVLIQLGPVGAFHAGAVPFDDIVQAGPHGQMPRQQRFHEWAGESSQPREGRPAAGFAVRLSHGHRREEAASVDRAERP